MELNKIQSSGNWGKAADDLNQNFSKVNNAVEQVKNTTTRNKGYFSSDTELKSAFPSANVGDIAYVGSAYPYQTWSWDGSEWKKKNDAGGEESVNLGDYYTKEETDEKFTETDEKLSQLASKAKANDLENSINANRYGYNITINGLEGGIHTLVSAIKDVPAKHRMLGQKITFRTENGDWATYHNESLSLDNYENVNDWVQEVGISSVTGDINISNNPDYEDLTEASDGTIKFADKEYSKDSFSGLGRVYLRKNIVDGVNVLTQDMMSKSNTIYIIQYDYDLQGEEITIPEGCVLDFKGGSLSNGTIIGDKTEITGVTVMIFYSIQISGSWNVPYISTKMFYSLDEVNDLYNIIAFSNADTQNTIIIEDKGTPYLIDINVNEGEGLKLNSNTNLVINGHVKLLPNKFSNYYLVSAYNVSNVKISGNGIIEGDKYTHISDGGEWGHCIRIISSTNIVVNGLKVCNAWGDCIDISESNNVVVSNSLIEEGRRQGISVIGADNVIIENCQIKHVGGTDPQSAIDYEPNKGQISYNLLVRNCIIEDCLYGIISYVPSSSSAHTLSIENCNIENTYGAVAINGVSNCVIKNSILKSSKKKENSNGELVYNSSVVNISNTNTTKIVGCTIEGLTDCAIFPLNNGRISIESNEIICNKGVRSCSNAEIKSNKFTCTSLIYIESATLSNTIIENNEISSTITFKSSNTYLNNNKIIGNLTVSGSNATISGNSILGNIKLSGSYHNIVGNTLDGYFIDTSEQDIIANNTIKNYLDYSSVGGNISNNTILSYVFLKGENIYFHSNSVETSNIGDNGYVTYIIMSEAENIIISSNVIRYTGSVMVDNIVIFTKKHSSCMNNTIYTNDLCSYGIHLLESDNVISMNKITGTASDRLIGPKVNNTYYKNINYANNGTYSKLPTIEEDITIHDESVLGFTYYITDYNIPSWWNGENWVDSDGRKANKKTGTTENRPLSPSTGHLYYDTTLKKPIWWTGTKWVDATGAEV